MIVFTSFAAARRIRPDVGPVIVVLVVRVSSVVVRVTVVREGTPVRRLALPQLLRPGLGRTLSPAERNTPFENWHQSNF